MKLYLGPVLILAAAGLLSACTGARRVTTQPSMPHPPVSTPAVTEAHYRVYTAGGQPATFDDLVAAMGAADVVFVGETHDDPVGHAVEARILTAAHARYGAQRPVALSLEMFDRDVQYIVDEYLDSLITERHFLGSSHPWGNYETDYRPMVEYARVHGLPVVAANTPRRYVNRVSRLGPASLDALGERARAALPPLPYPEPTAAYREKWRRAMEASASPHASAGASADSSSAAARAAASPHGAAPAAAMPDVSNLLHAQALWDAGMAYSIARHLAGHPGALVVHVVGGFHVEGGTGTPEALAHYRAGARMLNVALRPARDLATFSPEFAGHGDFVILTDATVPRSFRP
jgi:uncharacterized iron-regulated protein